MYQESIVGILDICCYVLHVLQVTAVQLLLPFPRFLPSFLYLHAVFLPARHLKARQGYLLRLVYIRNRRLLVHWFYEQRYLINRFLILLDGSFGFHKLVPHLYGNKLDDLLKVHRFLWLASNFRFHCSRTSQRPRSYLLVTLFWPLRSTDSLFHLQADM